MAHSGGEWLELATSRGSSIRVLKAMHPRARRLRLSVTAEGARVSYPRGTQPAQLSAFLQHNADWLETKLREMGARRRRLAPLKPGVDSRTLLGGEPISLRWAESEWPAVERRDDALWLLLPRPFSQSLPQARNLLVGHWEQCMRRDIARWLPRYVGELGRAPLDLRIRARKSLWGSLDTRDRITLDLSLAMAPRAALRYVLVHELCHLRVRNHSPRFWQWVERLYPDYRSQRDWLRDHGVELKAELDRLLASG